MNASTTQTFLAIAFAILLPAVLSFPYPIYGITNYRRAVRANNNPLSHSSVQSYDEQPYRTSSHYPNGHHQQQYENDPANYYLGDNGGPIIDRHRMTQYQYGRPTYHGEYKPTPYYYAGPKYSYYDDRVETTNPLDDLHEEMLQEDERERQHKMSVGQEQWIPNTGEPKSLTNAFMQNLQLYNNRFNMDPEPEIEPTAYDDEDDAAYYSDMPVNQKPFDYYEPKTQPQQAQYLQLPANKQQYFSHAKNKDQGELFTFENDRLPYNEHDDENKDDKEVQELKSLSKNQKADWDDSNESEAMDARHTDGKTKAFHTNIPAFTEKLQDATAAYNGYDSGFDYDDDAWINWDRKRSLLQKQSEGVYMKPLKALEYQLTMALQAQADALKILSTTTTTTQMPLPSLNSVLNLLKSKNAKNHEGQKEVVLSRPATPMRHHFSDPVFEALTENSNGQQTKNAPRKPSANQQVESKTEPKTSETKIQKRFVSNQKSLEQQLNDLKHKIQP